MSKLNQILSDYAKAKAEFQTKLQTSFKEAVAEFFQANPEVKAIVWTQYSPYFNDGDECTFSVHEPVFLNFVPESMPSSVYGIAEDLEDESAWVYGSWDGTDNAPAVIKDADVLSQAMQGGLEEVLEDMFGNHVIVMATAEGFESDDYSHD